MFRLGWTIEARRLQLVAPFACKLDGKSIRFIGLSRSNAARNKE